MYLKAKEGKEGWWLRLPESRQWRRIKSVKHGRLLSIFKLEGDVPAYTVEGSERIALESHPGWARNYS